MLPVKHILLLLLVLAGYVAKTQSCDFVLKGHVIDADENEHLGFAIIKILESGIQVETNADGEFVFKNLCVGKYQILIKHFGCRDTVVQIDMTKSRKIVIRLPHNLNNLGEVDIMDKREEMKKTQAVNQLTPEEIDKSRGQNLGDVLKNITGVTSLNTGASISKPMLHGMQGYRLLILNNGVRQEGQQWGNEHAPEIDPFMAKKISVVKGVAAIRYGSDAIAGVVLVEPEELPDTSAIKGEINLVGLSNGKSGAVSAMLEGNLEKVKNLSWRLQGSLKKGGNVKTPDYFLSNTGLREKNFSFDMGYHYKKWGLQVFYSQFNTSIGIFQGSHISNLTDLNNALSLNKPVDSLAGFSYNIDRPKQEVKHELIKSVAHYHFSTKWRAKLQYAWQYNLRQEYDLRRLTNLEKQSGVVAPDLDLSITSQTADALIEHDNIKSYRGQFGVSYMHQANTYQGRFFIPNYLGKSIGVFAIERYYGKYVELELGVRFDEKQLQSYFFEDKVWTGHSRHFNNLSYNGGLIFKPRSDLNVLVNAGSAWRAPSPNELYSNGIHQGVAAIERGNPNFKTETCLNLSSTLIYKTKYFSTELTAYHNRFKNFVYLHPTGQKELTIRGAFPVFEYKQDDVRLSGVDFKTECLAGAYFSAVLSGMVVRAWNLGANDYLIYIPSDRLNLNLKLKPFKHKRFKPIYVQINNQYVSKQWRVPANVDFAPPPEAYYLLGLEAGAELNVRHQKLNVHFSATNLLNQRYREYLDRFRYYADANGVSYNLRISLPLTIYHKPPVK